MFNYEKLDTWQEAIAFANLVYATTKTFPDNERFGLTNQMRRAAVSISSNIAEGSSRNSRPDFARFVEIATGSIFEVASQAFIARDQGFLSPDDFKRIYDASEKLGKMLSGLPIASCGFVLKDQRSCQMAANLAMSTSNQC